MAVQDYIDKIIPQHRSKPKFIAWLTAKLTLMHNIETLFNSIADSFDLDNAVGVQLDMLGTILGTARTVSFQPSGGVSPVLTDDHYRLVLRARILQNQWDGTRGQYDDMLETLFADYPIVIVDNSDMSMGVAYVLRESSTLVSELMTHGYLVPVPAGVTTELVSVPSGTWGNLFYRGFKWGDLASYTWGDLATGI